MLISKDEFVEAIEVYKNFDELEMKLYDLGIDILEQEAIQQLQYKYVDLLNLLMNQKRKDLQNTDLEYFIYDVNCGEYCDNYYIKEKDGSIIKWHNAEEFYDFIETLENQLECRNLDQENLDQGK